MPPHSSESRAEQVRRLREKGAIQEVLDQYGRLEEDPEGWKDVELVLEVARAWSLAGDETQVEKFFLRCAHLNRRRAALYRCQIGWFYQRRKRWRRALEWYERSLETFRSYHLCLFRKGYCLERLHRPAEAAAALAAATTVFDRSAEDQQKRSRGIQIQVLFHLSRNLRESGDLTSARDALERSRLLDTAAETVIKQEHRLASLAEIHLAEGTYEEALGYLEEARARDPRSSVIEERRGRALDALGRDEEAETALLRATELPKGPVALLSLARFYRTRRRFEEAARAIMRALKEHPQGEIQMRTEQAALLGALGRPRASLTILERLSSGRVPEGSALAARVENAIASIHVEHGNLSEAIARMERAMASGSASSATLERLARLKERLASEGESPVPMQDADLPEELRAVLDSTGEPVDGEVVSWFPDRGFGFIAHGPENQTIFFHVSHCRGFDESGPARGQHVSFVVGRNHRTGKSQAEEVRARAPRAAAASA